MKGDFHYSATQRHNLRMAFISAAEQGNVAHARTLLARAQQDDIDADTLDQALTAAARRGLSYFVRFMMDETRLDITRAGADVLAQALRDRDIGVADVLTEKRIVNGTQITAVDISAASAEIPDSLSIALEGGEAVDTDLLQLLMDRGAKINGDTHDAVDAAIAANSLPALQLLLPHADNGTQTTLDSRLLRAAGKLDLDAINLLLQAGADAAYHDGEAAKRALAFLQKGHTSDKDKDAACCLHALLEAGADKTGAIAEDALVAAVRRKVGSLVHYLLKKGVDPEPRWRGIGYNPLVIAANHGFLRLVEQIHQTARPADHYYHEAMHAAAERGNVTLLQQIIGYGFDPKNIPEVDLPFAAAVGGQLALVKSLMAEGLTTDLTHDALIEAVITGDHAEMLDYMLEQGAPLHAAREIHTKTAQINNKSRPYPAIQQLLEKWDSRGETIGTTQTFGPALDDLRGPRRDHEGHVTNGLLLLAQAGRFDEVLKRQNVADGNILTPADLETKDVRGNRLIDILGAHHELPKLLDPAKWPGRRADMMALLDMVPPVYRTQVDHARLTAEYRHEILQQTALKKRPPRL